jgi:CRP-like cAMP-binding protein
MQKQNDAQQATHAYHFLHLTPEELTHLPPEELLQACLEYRRLLLTLVGILATPERNLTVRAVAMDIVSSQAHQLAQGQLADEAAPVVYDVKQVSERLGLRPAEVRKAYEELAARGGVHILDRWFPRKREQQLSLPLDAQISPHHDRA